MNRNHLLCGLLLAAACGGGGKKPTTTTDVTDNGGIDTGGGTDTGGGANDPGYAARKAFNNPGGMWMPRQMNHPTHAAALQSMGVKIPAADLANPLAAPLNAVVSLGGCTASCVSPEGLVITNHHCVQGSLQLNATPAKNLVENGFLARTRAEELPAGPTQHVYVMQASRDVTMQRLYLETMQDILSHTPAVIVDDQLKGVIPFLPLNDVGRPVATQAPAPAAPAAAPRVGATR